jgi:SNF2 family DNA or RNA helicase
MPFLTESSPRAVQPERIKTTMKPHQLTMLKACSDFETKNENSKLSCEPIFNMGLIGDKVGSGKSLMALSIIAQNNPIKKSDIFLLSLEKHTGYMHLSASGDTSILQLNTSLIVVPHPTFNQWKKYIENETTLKCAYFGEIKEMKTLDEQLNDVTINRKYREEFFSQYDLVCVSSLRTRETSMYTHKINNIYRLFEHIKFKRTFIDECDTIYIHHNFRITNTNFTWFISSSVDNIKTFYPKIQYKHKETGEIRDYFSYNNGFTVQVKTGGIVNSHGDIHNYFSPFVGHTHIFNQMCFINKPEFIAQSFLLNSPIFKNIVCKNPRLLKVLGEVINTDIINMINAGDYAGAISKFDCDKTTSDNIISAITEDIRNKIIGCKEKIVKISDSTGLKPETKVKQISTMEDKITKYHDKIKYIEEKLRENECCCICYEQPEAECFTKCCNTRYCLNCITHVLKSDNKKCPYCRTNISNNTLLIVDNNKVRECASSKSAENELKDKETEFYVLVDKLLNDIETKHKILVFSDFTGSFKDIKEKFDNAGYKYSTMMGGAKVVNNKIEKYKGTKLDILMLTTKHCGSGLNLENTTDIIMYHSLSKDMEKQVIGRALRPGHEGELTVWKLLNENEVK